LETIVLATAVFCTGFLGVDSSLTVRFFTAASVLAISRSGSATSSSTFLICPSVLDSAAVVTFMLFSTMLDVCTKLTASGASMLKRSSRGVCGSPCGRSPP
jgi:hypothetical protein